MPFDPTTATEVTARPAFDPSTASPAEDTGAARFDVTRAGALGRKTAAHAANVMRQMDEGVDYSGMNDPSARAMYSLLSTPDEKLSYLKTKYGAENVTQDTFGRPVVKQGGKLVSFEPRGDRTGANLGADIAGFAGEVLPGAGMVAGGMIGAPLGITGSIVGAGLGSAAGEAFNKVIKNLAGNNLQTSGETAKDISLAVPQGMAAEGASQLGMLFGRSIMAPYAERSLLGPNEAAKPAYRQAMADVQAARDAGLTPAIGTAAPGAGFVQRGQNARNRLFGDPLGLQNRPVIEAKNQALMGDLGAAPGPISREAATAQGEALNSQLSRAADTTIAGAEATSKAATQDAIKILQDAQNALTTRIGAPTGNLANATSQVIQNNKAAFAQKASDIYAPVDALVGKPVISNQGIKDVMKQIISEGPQTVDGKPVLASDAIRKFANDVANMSDFSTFQQMQIIRSTFRDKSALEALNAGLSERQASRLAAAADQSFDSAAKPIIDAARTGNTFLDASGMLQKQGAAKDVQAAVSALRRGDQFYAAGMKRFGDLSVEALVKDATQSGFIQPEKVAQYIAAPGQVDKLLRIKKVISPETFQEVGREKWSQMINSSTDSLTADVSGKKLADRIMQMGPSLEALYGTQQAQDMRRLAQHLAAMDGKVPLESLQSGSITDAIKKSVDSEIAFKKVISNDYLGLIKTDGSQSLKAADYLTNPENRLKLRNAISALGPDAPETQGLKEYLARKIFSSMEVPAHATQEKFGKTVLDGQALKNELDKYGKPYLEKVFGKQWSDTVHKWADVVATGTKRNPSDSGGLVAASTGLHWFKNLKDVARYAATGWATNTQPMITYMQKGIPGTQGDIAQVLRSIGGFGTRVGVAEEIQRQPQNAEDYALGIKNHALGK